MTSDQWWTFLLGELGAAGRRELGRYMWHEGDEYVRFLAEFFLRRSNRSTVQRHLLGFLDTFPSFEDLADADPEDVVAAARWAGLRKRVARLPEVAREFLSRETWSSDDLEHLPHLGRYASQGIALYVLDQPAFPVDNNVRRVVGRYLGLKSEEEVLGAAAVIVERVMTEGGVGLLKDVHRGALALGWRPCARKPRCEACPLACACDHALGRRTGSAVA